MLIVFSVPDTIADVWLSYIVNLADRRHIDCFIGSLILFSRRAVEYRLALSHLSLRTGLEHVSCGVGISGIAAAQQKILSHSLLKGCDIVALNLIGSELCHGFFGSRLLLMRSPL